jgi:diaminopimelate epimerase
MKFSKWHGIGNDFVLMTENPDSYRDEKLTAMSLQICDRHFGVGADGLIFVWRPTDAHLQMRIFNADGSEAEMCGNGLRCAALAAYRQGMVKEAAFKIDTRAGVMVPEMVLDGERVTAVRVDMGEPVLDRQEIPVVGEPGTRVIDEEILVDDRKLEYTAVSMGNPHCLLYVSDVQKAPVLTLGPKLEKHRAFPRHTNVEFIRVDSPEEVTVRVWERGVGETLACGTGACATVVGGVLTGRNDPSVRVNLPGGQLFVEWATNNHVYLTGPAQEVSRGELTEEFLSSF